MEITRGYIAGAQKVVVYGPEGIGKSTFASQFPNPVFIDTEGSTKHMDVSRTPKPNSWTMILEQVRYFKSNPFLYNTIVIDTADWAEILCANETCSKSQKSSIEDFGYGKGYVYLAEEFGKLLNLLEEIIDLGMNVVVTAHAQMRKFEQPDEIGSYDRWEMKLQKKTAPLLKEWADMVLFANYKTYVVNVDGQGAIKGKNKAQGGKRVMYTTHNPSWDAKNRHDLALELPFEYKAIDHCIVVGEGSFKAISTNTKSQTSTPKEPPTSTPTTVTQINKNEKKISDSTSKKDIENVLKSSDQLEALMTENKVTIEEIQKAVASKGYYPENTPILNYDANFISGVLVGAWPQVFKMIIDIRNKEAS